MDDLEGHLALALELADTADEITMARWRASDLVVETKPDMTPVSEADRAVEAAIRERLSAVAPDHAVHGEEYGAGDGDAAHRWIVDPIDGTKGYVRGLPIWATLLALEHAGELVVGVVSAPALHARWWAARGLGAYRDGEPIHVSAVHDLADAQLSFAWDDPEGFSDGFGARAIDLSARCWRTRALGDFWHHVLVAEGALDLAAEPSVAVWDVAPLPVLLEEAGGRFTDLEGRVRVDGGSALSSNGHLHDAALAILGPP